jgi:hypothetical protein
MMSISAGMYEVTSRPTSCSRTAGFDQTFMTSSYFGKMPSKIGWPRRGPTHWSDDLFLGSLQSADPEHASPDRHGGYKPQAPHERKSKGLTNACAIRHLIGTRRRPYRRLPRAQHACPIRSRQLLTWVVSAVSLQGRLRTPSGTANFGGRGEKPSRRRPGVWKMVLILLQRACQQ